MNASIPYLPPLVPLAIALSWTPLHIGASAQAAALHDDAAPSPGAGSEADQDDEEEGHMRRHLEIKDKQITSLQRQLKIVCAQLATAEHSVADLQCREVGSWRGSRV